ncbi:hypothetical protein BB559_006590 [Furculomyces boomerangus]|uniref:Uncharacterized protein n=2 Tax=Harpellales TaxID=61421 RepID=A0A2T9Y1P1_9FUNG|nr:hypothetical protein BB559_006590 [Furculomyces boomerangus]PWA03746.1 hypothetical protein BB558_000081 [Smittium angustum]
MAQIDDILYTSDFEETTNPCLIDNTKNNNIQVEDNIFNDILDEFSQEELYVKKFEFNLNNRDTPMDFFNTFFTGKFKEYIIKQSNKNIVFTPELRNIQLIK